MRLVLVWTKPSLGLFSAFHTVFHRAAGMGPQAHRRFLPWRCSLWVASHFCPPSVPERSRSKGEVALKKALFQLRCSVCLKEEHAAFPRGGILVRTRLTMFSVTQPSGRDSCSAILGHPESHSTAWHRRVCTAVLGLGWAVQQTPSTLRITTGWHEAAAQCHFE